MVHMCGDGWVVSLYEYYVLLILFIEDLPSSASAVASETEEAPVVCVTFVLLLQPLLFQEY